MLDSSWEKQQLSWNVIKAFYEITMINAKYKKNCSIGKSLIKSRILLVAKPVHGKNQANNFSPTSLSNAVVQGGRYEPSLDNRI